MFARTFGNKVNLQQFTWLVYTTVNSLALDTGTSDTYLAISRHRPNTTDSMMVTIENIPPARYLIDSSFCDSICVFNCATYRGIT